LGLARIGFLHALAHGYGPRHVDYSCDESQATFRQYERLSPKQLEAQARSFGPVAWPFLPFKLRRVMLDRLISFR
jgi:hypothetical protein